MGNCCGKSSDDGDNFTGPGRVLGSSNAPSSNPPAPIPDRSTKPTPKPSGSSRTARPAGGGPSASSGEDPRAAAARAAEERENKKQSQQKGKLGEQLEAQKKQTRTDTLDQISKDNQAAREADAARRVQAYD